MEHRDTIQHMIPAALMAAAVNKPVELQLAWYFSDYKVIAISNTTILKPGEWLSVAAVDQINNVPNWTVKMADNEVISALFGIGTGVVSEATKL